jgi:tetratricopeptide (TPR) repeat protein
MTPSRLFAAVAVCLFLATAPVLGNEIQEINLQFRKGDLAGALERANQFLASNPKDAQARFLKGLILADQGKSNEAIQVFSGLTEDYPELPEPYNNLAVLYAAQSKYDAAKNALEMAIRTHPSYATAHENLGDIYAKMASIAYDKALQLDTANTTAQTKLALIKELVGGQPRRATPAKPQAAASGNPAPLAAAPAKPVTSAPASDRIEVTLIIEVTLTDWAQAWSKRDPDSYLAFYASDFAVPDGLSRTDWEAQRRERIGKARRIDVQISNLKIEQSAADKATATFRQTYRSDRLNSNSTKTLELALRDEKWKIVRESSR